MKITVIGAGNIGTQFAVSFAAKGYDVALFASNPNKISKTLRMVEGEGGLRAQAELKLVTNNMADAVKDSRYIFVTHPAFMLKMTAEMLYNCVEKGAGICVVPGTGGAEFFFKKLVDKGVALFGLQRVPSVARLVEYGKTVCTTGYRNKLDLAGIPKKETKELADILRDVFCMPCNVLPNYLCVTLTPSNPILHTTRLKTLFEDYREGVVYKKNPLFYEEWSDKSSKLLFACDEELQQVCKSLSELELTDVRSLKLHYESDTPEKLTKKICSIKSLQGLTSPMREVEGGLVPDFRSRYFTADFPYGLAILKEIADVAGVPVPNMAETLRWYEDITGDKSDFRLADYGICTKEDLYEFYMR